MHLLDGSFGKHAVEARKTICEAAVGKILATRSNGLRAIVLTGSVARDEGTFVTRSGNLELLGDADFLLVYEGRAKAPNSDAEITLSRNIEETLSRHEIRCKITAHAVLPKYFRALRPSIFSYELKTCGRIVWGDSRVLDSIREFSVADIPREDAWRLLCNRMIEHLAFVEDLSCVQTELSEGLYYATLKLFIDMATSYLIFAGQYAPSYRERAQRLCELKQHSNQPFPLNKFASRVAECTAWKISCGEEPGELRMELWQEALSYARRLWRWEMIELAGMPRALTISELSAEFARKQTAKQRLRGWLSLAKRCGWLKSAASAPRWMNMALRSTPRYLTYRAAAEVVFRLPCLVKHDGRPPRLDVDWKEIRSSLPQHAPQSRSRATENWQELVRDVLWNYSQFLEGTDA